MNRNILTFCSINYQQCYQYLSMLVEEISWNRLYVELGDSKLCGSRLDQLTTELGLYLDDTIVNQGGF